MITFEKLQLIKELITLLVDDYTTGLLLKVIAIDLSIQEALGADLKLKKLKLGVKNGTEEILKISSNLIKFHQNLKKGNKISNFE